MPDPNDRPQPRTTEQDNDLAYATARLTRVTDVLLGIASGGWRTRSRNGSGPRTESPIPGDLRVMGLSKRLARKVNRWIDLILTDLEAREGKVGRHDMGEIYEKVNRGKDERPRCHSCGAVHQSDTVPLVSSAPAPKR